MPQPNCSPAPSLGMVELPVRRVCWRSACGERSSCARAVAPPANTAASPITAAKVALTGPRVVLICQRSYPDLAELSVIDFRSLDLYGNPPTVSLEVEAVNCISGWSFPTAFVMSAWRAISLYAIVNCSIAYCGIAYNDIALKPARRRSMLGGREQGKRADRAPRRAVTCHSARERTIPLRQTNKTPWERGFLQTSRRKMGNSAIPGWRASTTRNRQNP